ncbi:hypothetical protein P7K49_039040, partial [Saguinus oedipus]
MPTPYVLVPGVPQDVREDGPGGIIACEAGLAHASVFVNEECSDISSLMVSWWQ